MLLWAAIHQLDAIRFISLCSQFVQFSSALQSCWSLCNAASPTPGAYSSSCSLTCLCHQTISSCLPRLFLPSVFPNIRVFSNESILPIRWTNNWSFNFSISFSSEYSGMIFLGWTGVISLQSKGLSRVFSNSLVQRAYMCVICQWCHIPPVGI